MEFKVSRNKKLFLFGIVFVYVVLGIILFVLVNNGIISKAPPAPIEVVRSESEELQGLDIRSNLEAAQLFVQDNLQSNGHIDLYYMIGNETYPGAGQTNSEAVSYYLFWNAQAKNKDAFDKSLDYVEDNMIHPKGGYLMWRLEEDDSVKGDGANIATDADLRALRALILAKNQWGDEKYDELFDKLSAALEKVAITNDTLFAPYGGYSNSYWGTDEVWLSYGDFNAFRELADKRGEPWNSVYDNMKMRVIEAQTETGLYRSALTTDRAYTNDLDEDMHSINSLWIMVRAAESGDAELMASSAKALAFYKNQFYTSGKIVTAYTREGEPAKDEQAPWVYALVARAAIALDDQAFSTALMQKLASYQVGDTSSDLYGAIVEGDGNTRRVGQFTMQESIITMQAYFNRYGNYY